MSDDLQTGVDEVVRAFFSLFDNRSGEAIQAAQVERIFHPQASITKRTGNQVEVMTLETFLEPRRRLLSEGRLVDFHEWEVETETFGEGGIATRLGRYRKEGVLDGQPYRGEGRKSIQLVRMESGWRITAVLWEDDA